MESGEVLAIVNAVYNEHFAGYYKWKDDLIGEGVLGVLVCEQKYNPSKGKFIVYAWRSAWGRMMAWCRSECKHRVGQVEVDDLDNYAGVANGGDIEWGDIRAELQGVRLKRALHNAIIDGLLDGERACDLADKFGVSRQVVSEVWKRWKCKVACRFDFVEGNIVPK